VRSLAAAPRCSRNSSSITLTRKKRRCFPRAKKLLSSEELADLGERLEARKNKLLADRPAAHQWLTDVIYYFT
jgi:hypothetical protein